MTVVIGVVTVAVATVGMVTVTAVLGVLTVTAADTVGIGTAGTETVGTPSAGDDPALATGAADEEEDAGVASALERCFDAGALVVALEVWRGPRWPGVEGSSGEWSESAAGATAGLVVPSGATARAATAPAVAIPAARTTAVVPLAIAT